MAKRGRRSGSRLERAAEGMGRLLGHVAGRVDALKQQRAEVMAELDHVGNVVRRLKADLGPAVTDLQHATATALRAGKRARRTMSPEARAKISAAARKRWAAFRKARKA